MIKLLVAALAVVLTLGTSGCAGQDEQATASLSESFQQEDVGGIPVSEKQADCMAEDIVAGVGVEQLEEYGVLGEDGEVGTGLEIADLADEDADTVAAALVDCIGAETIVEEEVIEPNMAEAQQDCIRETMTEERLEQHISAGFRSAAAGSESARQLEEDMDACMKP